MNWWEAVVLGIVQGLTEFLPISSSAHVRVVGQALPHGGDPGAAFTAVIQLGTEIAVLWYFRHDIARILSQWTAAVAGRHGRDRAHRLGAGSPEARLGWWVILGSVPIVILGFIFKDAIESHLRNLWITAAVLAVFAVVLGLADRLGAKKRDLETLRARDAWALGLAQAGALVPGVSRSGGTISMGLLLGLTREAAARYSFLLAIPAVIGSALFELATNAAEITDAGGPGMGNTAIAVVVSGLVGYAVIVWFFKLLKHHSFMPFVVYRIALAGVIFALLAAGALSPLG